MNFKESVAADIDGVFLNADEFAETVDFNGKRVKAVKSGAGLEAYKTAEYVSIRGVANRYQRISVKTEELPENVFISATAYIDGEPWIVEDMEDRAGVTGLVLSHSGAR